MVLVAADKYILQNETPPSFAGENLFLIKIIIEIILELLVALQLLPTFH